MTKSAFLTQTDTSYIKKLRQSTLTILNTSKNDWSCEEILRFMALLKVQSKLQNVIYQFQLTGEQLFNVHYLYQNMSKHFDENNYFLIMKLIYVINQINCIDRKQPLGQKIQFENQQSKKSPFEKPSKLKSKIGVSSCLPDKNIPRNYTENITKKNSNKDNNLYISEQTSQVDLCMDNQIEQSLVANIRPMHIKGQEVKKIKDELVKNGDTSVIQLSTIQLVKLFRATDIGYLIALADVIKKLSLDGFILMYLFADRKIFLPEIESHLSQQTLNSVNYIFYLLLPQYIRQSFNKKKMQKLPLSNHIENYEIQFYDLKSNLNLQQFNRNYNYKPTQSFRGSQCGKSEFGQSQYGQSQFGQSEQGSQIIQEYGTSQCGNSQYPNQQYANSQYVFSQRGSIRNSMAESVFDSQDTHQTQIKPAKVNPDIRISSYEDLNIVKKLKAAALNLPFNLFNLQPLQFIRITGIPYPFSLKFQNKPTTQEQMVKFILNNLQIDPNGNSSSNNFNSKEFNLTGAKFGRNQQNDFRFPDQLSISGKHAQITFFDNKYQLFDMGSKTGTFIYIPMTRPITLKDEQIIQLSTEIQIVVHIIKTDKTDGTIKLEFNRPQNQPFYKASLKNNQTLRIGRSQKCHIKLPHQSLSSKHCQIKYINQKFIIYDCLSTTGTWLRISKKGQKSTGFEVKKGDIIRISSKKTYVIQNLKQNIEQEQQKEEDQQKYLSKYFQNPKFKEVTKKNSEDKFNQIIEKAWNSKEKTQLDRDKK